MQRNTLEEVNSYIRSNECDVVVGIDEAGRGTWAGPIVAAAAAVPTNLRLPAHITDSKKFGSSKKGRAQIAAIYDQFRDHSKIHTGIGVVRADEIDEMGIDKAQATAQGKALAQVLSMLPHPPLVVVDGINPPSVDVNRVRMLMCVPKGDALVPAVGLASIIAKATQLRHMVAIDRDFPDYGFASNAGYGTKTHQEALKKFGPCMCHRYCYRPVKEAAPPPRTEELESLIDTLMEEI